MFGIVDVEQCQADGRALAFGTLYFAVNRFIHPAPVERTGELVFMHLFADLFQFFFQLFDSFCGNEGGGETWAVLASLLNTCKLHGVDPETYLTDILERMVSGATKNNKLDELLVWNWKAAREAEKIAA